MRVKTVSHCSAVLALKSRFELQRQRGAILLSGLARREAHVADQVFAPDRFGQRLELLLLVRGDIEQPASRLERSRRRSSEVVVADRMRLVAGDQVVRHDPAHRHQRRVEHRDIDERAFAGVGRRTSALVMANPAVMPPIVSATG